MAFSEFQFSKPTLLELEFRVNSEYSDETNPPNQVNCSLSIGRNTEEPEATVSLTVYINDPELSDGEIAYVKAVMAAEFHWNEKMDEETLDSMLKLNAPSLLLSYVRPIVSMVSGTALPVPLHIPFINFTEVEYVQEEYQST